MRAFCDVEEATLVRLRQKGIVNTNAHSRTGTCVGKHSQQVQLARAIEVQWMSSFAHSELQHEMTIYDAIRQGARQSKQHALTHICRAQGKATGMRSGTLAGRMAKQKRHTLKRTIKAGTVLFINQK
mmetsp:Transcript_55614/g.92116  ORF Transcript_55614/g.92116 Transcript_55614/m.92116 type:complete len:127 (+) Transcript_55614:954-1334(+)